MKRLGSNTTQCSGGLRPSSLLARRLPPASSLVSRSHKQPLLQGPCCLAGPLVEEEAPKDLGLALALGLEQRLLEGAGVLGLRARKQRCDCALDCTGACCYRAEQGFSE